MNICAESSSARDGLKFIVYTFCKKIKPVRYANLRLDPNLLKAKNLAIIHIFQKICRATCTVRDLEWPMTIAYNLQILTTRLYYLNNNNKIGIKLLEI